jgi:GAF domain-containing protein
MVKVDAKPGGSICSTTICSNDVLIVPDLTKDQRFAQRDMVTGEPHLRFYAGAPLVNSEGFALGSLCVFDYQPHAIDARQLKALSCLARQAVAQLELRRKISELKKVHSTLYAERLQAENFAQFPSSRNHRRAEDRRHLTAANHREFHLEAMAQGDGISAVTIIFGTTPGRAGEQPDFGRQPTPRQSNR